MQNFYTKAFKLFIQQFAQKLFASLLAQQSIVSAFNSY